MKANSYQRHCAAASLPLVLVFTAVSFLMLSGVLLWTTTTGALTARHNEYYTTLAAAEAATEKVIAKISRDFQNLGVNGVDSNLSSYGALVPTQSEVGDWANYSFADPVNGPNATYVTRVANWQYTDLNWQYTSFKGHAATYRVISNTRNTASGKNITPSLKQDVQIADIPLFEFGVFYTLDMEICPGSSDMIFTGRVHGNGSIYCQPGTPRTVTFMDHVTAAQTILHTASPNDSSIRTLGTVVYQAEHDWNTSSLNLPIGTNNNPALVHGIIEVPPTSEPTNSLMGLQRYYNKADLIILVSNSTAVAKSGAYNNFSVNVPWTNISQFVNTNASFYSSRENKTIQATEIDVQQFTNTYGYLSGVLGRPVKVLYVADLRTQTSSTESGVRLIHGQTLPANGLTVATCNPLYVKGHYNAPSASLGTTNTTQTFPASLVADAITILSASYSEPNGGNAASDTTINAALIAGIVPSAGGVYSGGVENFFRLLENWSSRTLTVNGSIVALFPSQIATASWGASGVYSPPQQRAYSFDFNFKDVNKLPPGTPEVRTLIRAAWNITQAGSTQ